MGDRKSDTAINKSLYMGDGKVNTANRMRVLYMGDGKGNTAIKMRLNT